MAAPFEKQSDSLLYSMLPGIYVPKRYKDKRKLSLAAELLEAS